MSNKNLILFCGFFTTLILAIHLIFPSILNGMNSLGQGPILSYEFNESIWRLHKVHPTFAGRFTTTSLLSILNSLGLPFAWSFLIINFSLLFLNGILIAKISNNFGFNAKQEKISLLLFYLSFSILFAFFRSIDTYDDLIQYFFLFGSVLAFLKNKNLVGSTFFLASLMTRETGLLLIPGLFLIIKNRSIFYKFCAVIIPAVIFEIINLFIFYRLNLLHQNKTYLENSRFAHFIYNFQNLNFSIETIVSAFLVLAIPIYLVYKIYKKNLIEESHSDLLKAGAISILINTPIVLLSTRAREARLFALPLVFLWPLLGYYFEKLKIRFSFAEKKIFYINLFLIAILSAFIYKPTYSGGFDYGYRLYLFLFIIFFGIIIKNSKK